MKINIKNYLTRCRILFTCLSNLKKLLLIQRLFDQSGNRIAIG